MASELRKTILEADDLESETVTVRQWGDAKIEIRSLMAGQRNRLITQAARDGANNIDMEKYAADLVIATAHDPDSGEKIFDIADRDSLNRKNASAVELLFSTASRLSGLAEAAVTEAKENLSEAQSDDSSSS